ncbi:MAG: hypothetical protein HON90_15460, partial [Halobacteriovoraceae bacterium]|nr:hypothetical protein [Halobacteriovoraceae bacterium]
MHYMLCKESHWTKTLQKELIADFSKSNQTVGELPLIKIPCDVDLKDKYIAFSTTCLPNAFEITADSISQQTKKISENFIDQIPNNIKINFHVFGLTDKYGVLETGRAEIIKEKIFSVLKKKKIN